MKCESSQDPARVCVLMAVHNGAKYLPQQLDSLRKQTLLPFHVIIGDDGSDDNSVQLIKEAFETWPDCRLSLVEGPRDGSAANFINLFRHVPETADYVAMCDQDDVWLPTKLSAAVDALTSNKEGDRPLLFGSATWVCGPDLSGCKKSKTVSVELGFKHALVENYAGGNTMVMNRPAIDLIRQTLHVKSRVLVHDWWFYQLITGSGGKALYDPEPSALYRQHNANLIGDNRGLKARSNRIWRLIRGDYKKWTELNLAVLQEASHLLTPANALCVSDICARRRGDVWRRLPIIPTHQLQRQGAAGQIALWLAIILNRF